MANAIKEMNMIYPRLEFYWPVNGTGKIVFEIEWQEPPGEDEFNHCIELVKIFCDCGANGAFPIAGARSVQSSLLLAKVVQKSNTMLVCNIECKFADSACLGILANLIRSVESCGHPIGRVKTYISDINTQQKSVTCDKPNFANVADYYPLGAKQLSFIVEEDDSAIDIHKSRRCLIIAIDKYKEEMIYEFKRRVMTWVTLLEKGGFALPIRPLSEATVIFESFELYSDNIIELSFSLFEASEQSWLSLFSILDCASDEVNRLEGVLLS